MADEQKDIAQLVDGMPDLAEKFNRGELGQAEGTPDYGPRNERIPKKYQEEFRSLCIKIQLRDMYARIDEVKRAADADFYWRNVFDACFNDSQGTWEWGQDSPGLGQTPNDTGNTPLSYPLNIYQSKGRSFIKMVAHKPEVHFEAAGDAPHCEVVAQAAEALKKQIEVNNDIDLLAQRVAKIQYCEGRFVLYTRWVTDGAKYGYYDEEPVNESIEGLGEAGKPPKKIKREPKGAAKITVHGVLECKVPVNMEELSDFPYLQISKEIDISAARALYPDIAKKIEPGQPAPGDYSFDRTTRIAISQGMRFMSQNADSMISLPTWQRTWLRPCMFSEIEDEDCRGWFEDNYPDGAYVAFVGGTYAESRNESMDDHLAIGYPIVGDGQTTPAYGYSMLTAQDLFNDLIDLEMETHMKSIPEFFADPEIFDLPAYTRTKAQPGAAHPLKEFDAGIDVGRRVWATPQAQVSAQLIQLREAILTQISDIITGINAPAIGQTDENNTTFSGIALLQAASRGETGMPFCQWQKAYMRSLEQAVKIEARYREAEADEGKLEIQPRGDKMLTIDLADLQLGTYWCTPDSDQTYPDTFQERQAAFAALNAAASQGSQQAMQILNDPRNERTFAPLYGIPGIVLTGAASATKQLSEIQQLLDAEPVINPQYVKQYHIMAALAQQAGQPVPPPDPYQAYMPSIHTQKMDNDAAEYQTVSDWCNSAEGQRERRENPHHFLNVELHGLQHQKNIQDAQKQQAMMKLSVDAELEKMKHPPKHPAESISFKDLGPSGQLQLGAQAGLDLKADVASNMAEEVLTGGEQQQQEEKPNETVQ